MKILVFSDSDLTKKREFKKKNNILEFDKEEFKQYVKEHDLKLSKGYVDSIGFLSNGKKFTCNYKGFLVGVTRIIEEIENQK